MLTDGNRRQRRIVEIDPEDRNVEPVGAKIGSIDDLEATGKRRLAYGLFAYVTRPNTDKP